ncbi:ABC transporter permease [Ectobacillus antri]|jgi:ABC-2 type transport system permease protein|uniref:ABC transporter permease n=1 Tax=Ectobacillus antri TaxID=2486280 RepID=A0ABT6H173_9BACI|nr:ABC transporter permease [Ectobacillus antri]MDG4656342.1 ABC transporter permease [Ectobacillus antri]MDG5753017.1 ABC transporter permease [Ectobacillus antri]
MRNLFYQRLLYEWRQKWKVLRSVVDWTIALYFVVPVLVFAGIYHASLWDQTPTWVHTIPLPILCVPVLSLLSLGGVRSFLEAADSLFLIQSPHLQSVVKKGIGYTFLTVAIWMTVFTLYGLPLLQNGYELSVQQVMGIWLFMVYMTILQRCLQDLIYSDLWWERLLYGFVTRVVIILLTSGGVWLLLHKPVFLLFYSILLIIIWRCLQLKLRYRFAFLREVEREQKEAMKWTSTVMIGGGHLPKPVETKKPRIFPQSKRLLRTRNKEWKIAELFCKEYARTDTNRQFYFMTMSYSALSLWITPWWIASIVIAFASFALFKQSGEQWKVFKDKPMIRLYCAEGEVLLMAAPRLLVLVPALMLYMIAIVAVTYIWVALALVILLVVLCIPYVFFASKQKGN